MPVKIKKKTKKKGSPKKTPATPLRRRAEKKLAGGKKKPLPFKGNQQELIHQLQVHQVELEMQNEELRRAQEELTAARQRYIDLYDFAPAGYFTFDKMGRVVEANLSGARMLGVERAYLLRSVFAEFIAPEYRDFFHVHRQKVLQNGSTQFCELKLIRKDGSSFYAAVRSVGIRDQAGLIRSAFLDITERKEARERTEAEHRFREAIENSLRSGIAALDTEWRQTYVNPAFCRMVGWSREELLGAKPPFVYWPPEQTGDIREVLPSLKTAGNNSGTMEVRFQKRSGERFDALVLYSALKDARGNIIGWVASVGDITETKQKVREIQNLNRELEERVRQRTADLQKAKVLLDSIFESAPIGLGFWDKDLRIMRLNKTLAEIKGLPVKDHVGKKMSEVLPDSVVAKELEARWKQILLTGQPMTNIEVRSDTFAQPGQRRYWMNNWYPVRVDNEVIGIAAAVVDITERRQAEEAIRRQAELFRLSFDAIIVWRLDGSIESWNRGAEALYGYTKAEAIGQRTHELLKTVHPVPWPEIEAALNACGHWEGELRHRTKDGSEMVVLARHQLIGGTADIARVLETNRDITERKRAEEEIQRLNEALARRARELETSNKELDAFVSMVSHDLKNQMAVFGGLVGRLSKRQDKLDDQGRHYLGLLKESVGATFTLVDKLLEMSRAGKKQLKVENCNLSEMAWSILKKYRERDEDRQVDLVITERMEADGDCHLLEVVLDNLLGNAWKFTKLSDRTRIELGMMNEGERPVFFVRDNGCGFEMPEDPEKVFQPFQRFHSAEEYAGTGIGLATVKRILDRHGGRIWMESEVGKGTTVYFSLSDAPENEKGHG